MEQQIQLDEADDLLTRMGLNLGASTPEDRFMDSLTDGKCPRIASLRYWLNGEMDIHSFLLEKGLKVTKNTFKDGKHQELALTKLEYARIQIEYYLHMQHLPWFQQLRTDLPACDMANVIEQIIAYGDMKNVIERERK
jgi:hypothetical protein